MANLRRSARLSRTAERASTTDSTTKKTNLESVTECEGSSEAVSKSPEDAPVSPSTRNQDVDLFSRLNKLRTPQTEPKPGHGELNPKTIHQSTAKAPDSGLILGFADIDNSGILQPTPSKSSNNYVNSIDQQPVSSAKSNSFQFQFNSNSTLSTEAQNLMASVKADAAEIKARMLADQASGSEKYDHQVSTHGSPRKIATAKGKSGRFSDVHMEQFRKMDSIENHPSAFRARTGFAAPTSQSLKRKSSRVDLDEPIRPRTAGKGTPAKQPTTTYHKSNTTSPVKHQPNVDNHFGGSLSAKRARQTKDDDASTSRSVMVKSTSSTLYSPTKSSMARIEYSHQGSSSRPKIMPRSSSVKHLKSSATVRPTPKASNTNTKSSPMRIPQSQSMQFKPLPSLPFDAKAEMPQIKSSAGFKLSSKPAFASKFPSFSNLRSILRSGPKDRKANAELDSPKRAVPEVKFSSPKKVDFTPSVKSRYAVKLAAESPLPAKFRHDTPYKAAGPFGVQYDGSAYTVLASEEESSDSESGDVVYPELPNLNDSDGHASQSFSAKAKAINHRESQEFRSIFTDLRAENKPSSNGLTAINTIVNKTDPTIHAHSIANTAVRPEGLTHSSTIRPVRRSGASPILQPFRQHDHAPPQTVTGSKRRFESIDEDSRVLPADQGYKKRKSSALPSIPGAWTDTILEDQENQDPVYDGGDERGTKRIRTSPATGVVKCPAKKPNSAREVAAKNAKERKGKGLMSLSRLNFLSRPKGKH